MFDRNTSFPFVVKKIYFYFDLRNVKNGCRFTIFIMIYIMIRSSWRGKFHQTFQSQHTYEKKYLANPADKNKTVLQSLFAKHLKTEIERKSAKFFFQINFQANQRSNGRVYSGIGASKRVES